MMYFLLTMDRTKGAHYGHADDAASDYYGDDNKCHDALRVIDCASTIGDYSL